MTIQEKSTIRRDPDYLDTLKRLEDADHKPILIALGGSHAYGTNVLGSDIDIRGIYMNSRNELLGIYSDKEQYVTKEPDMQIYSLKKAIWLLQACNPAMIEILGCREQDYLFLSKEGQYLRDNVDLFLSKRITKTFGGYAKSQLNRLINRSGRAKNNLLDNEQRSFEKVFMSLAERYKGYLNPDFSVKQEDDELFLNFSFENMPVKKVADLLNEFNTIDRDYRKSFRNDKAIEHGKLSKHMMHLIRLYMMGTQILNERVVSTYRYFNEHELLMNIREGKYLEADGVTPTKEFETLLARYQEAFEKACERTDLPDEPNYEAINDLVIKLNTESL